MSDPVVRAQALVNLRHASPDARTSSRTLIVDRALLPLDSNAATINYDSARLLLAPACITPRPARVCFDLVRLIRDLHIPAAEWHCIARGVTLTFERVGQ